MASYSRFWKFFLGIKK